ncbi:MAG TPA: alkaline phosphatase family protein [Solirubrobacteraceae bacterium]
MARARLRGALASLDARLSAVRLPTPRVGALLVLGCLGFGVVIGSTVGSPADDTLAASAQRPLRIVVPAASAPAKLAEAPSSASEPPAAEPEPAPEVAAAPATATTAAPAPAPKAPPAGAGESKGGETGGGEGGPSTPPGGGAGKLPAIKHVFVIMLSDEPYAATFGPESAAPYLSHTLERRGTLLARYYGVAQGQLANGVALLSGQGPTPATSADCPTYEPVTPATEGGEGQMLGDGCVYPASTPTLPGELEVKRLTWRAYVQGVGEGGGSPPPCGHPAPGAADPTTAAGSQAPYATAANPIVYFKGLAEARTCVNEDVGLSSLAADLASAGRTPTLSYIVPDRCHDASPAPCPGGGPGGLPAADAFLQGVVPKILASKAYRQGGLLVITGDAAPSTGAFADSSSCCGQPRFPNLPPPTGLAASLPPEGGGQVGALLLSPFVKARTISQAPFNHFSLLRTIEDLFGLRHLGYAAGTKVGALEPSLFTAKR